MKSRLWALALVLATTAPLSSQQPTANAMVASDGSGTHKTDRPEREKTARYEEFRNTGPGGTSRQRVRWARPITDTEAQRMSPAAVLRGADGWNPLQLPASPR